MFELPEQVPGSREKVPSAEKISVKYDNRTNNNLKVM